MLFFSFICLCKEGSGLAKVCRVHVLHHSALIDAWGKFCAVMCSFVKIWVGVYNLIG